jgi:hypothetical protein
MFPILLRSCIPNTHYSCVFFYFSVLQLCSFSMHVFPFIHVFPVPLFRTDEAENISFPPACVMWSAVVELAHKLRRDQIIRVHNRSNLAHYTHEPTCLRPS